LMVNDEWATRKHFSVNARFMGVNVSCLIFIESGCTVLKALYISISLCFILVVPASAQKMYVSLANGQGLKKVNVTSTGCVSDAVVVCPDENYFALALYHDTLYYATNTFLYSGILKNDTLTGCHPVDFTPVGMSSMT